MGLDMFLNRKFYVWKSDRHKIKITGVNTNPEKLNYITEEAMYWRKANAIHSWFVENIQDGNDDCKEYYVPKEKLQELLALVKKVLKDHTQAEKLLPTQEGFFFGGTEYNEYYFQDLEDTKKALESILQNHENWEYYYHSSW